ncbi:MAG: histone deacetylase family protein [Candidatus Promineofilum sp.]|nr:histone deacetylase family protein [Promineifilum sp.]
MADSAFSVFYAKQQNRHHLANHPETPERAAQLLAGALDYGLVWRTPADSGLAAAAAVHSPALLSFFPTAYQRFAQLKEGPRPAVPDSFAVRELSGHIPRSIWGQLGHYCSDALTPIMEGTWVAAYWSAQAAVAGALAIDSGARLAYALCRPPGHHAYHDLYGGFCYLNNAAIAAQILVDRGRRPAILDIDYHHGNGTQAIFYERADVFFGSLHANPEEEYPYYCGFAHEVGRGEGEGYSLNLPLPPATEEVAYLRTLDHAMKAIIDFRPDVLLVSLGFDTLAGDSQGEMKLHPSSFRLIGRTLAEARLPILLVQEGGYRLASLRPAVTALLEGIGY